MLFNAPSRVILPPKYDNVKSINARMAVWFDIHFWNKERDDETCYKYLYLTYYMLGNTKHYFIKYEDTDKYAQFCASIIYVRLLRKLNNGEVIKSILNYAKKTCYPLKVMYQKQEFNYVANPKVDNKFDPIGFTNMLKENIQSQYNIGMQRDFEDAFKEIPLYAKEIVEATPYKDDKGMVRKLYLSCILSFTKSVTLCKYNVDRLTKRTEKALTINDGLLTKMFNKERETSTTLWRLDDSMKDYVKVLVGKLRQRLIDELISIKQSYAIDDMTLESILSSAWETASTYHHNNDEEDE